MLSKYRPLLPGAHLPVEEVCITSYAPHLRWITYTTFKSSTFRCIWYEMWDCLPYQMPVSQPIPFGKKARCSCVKKQYNLSKTFRLNYQLISSYLNTQYSSTGRAYRGHAEGIIMGGHCYSIGMTHRELGIMCALGALIMFGLYFLCIHTL